MAIYNIHAGHCPQGKGAYGAVGILQESVEDRLVKNRVVSALRKAGQTVYDCTDDTNCDVNTNLARIVAKCNMHAADLDISIHLNSGRGDYKGDHSTGGVEVWCYDSGTAVIAQRICDSVSKTLKIHNRGVKYSQELYVLNSTLSPALLVECCFVDDKDDANLWDANACGDAIASAILGRSISGGPVKEAARQIPGKAAYAEKRLNYRVHQQSYGWLPVVRDGQIAGVTGKSKRLEALKIDLKMSGVRLKASAHIQNIGTVDYGYITRNTVIGTVGKSLRLEAVRLEAEGLPDGMDIYIRYHVQGDGWSVWIKGGEAGTYGLSKRLEALQIKIS